MIGGLQGGWRARILDETNAENAMRSPASFRQEYVRAIPSADLILPPLGLVKIN